MSTVLTYHLLQKLWPFIRDDMAVVRYRVKKKKEKYTWKWNGYDGNTFETIFAQPLHYSYLSFMQNAKSPTTTILV